MTMSCHEFKDFSMPHYKILHNCFASIYLIRIFLTICLLCSGLSTWFRFSSHEVNWRCRIFCQLAVAQNMPANFVCCPLGQAQIVILVEFFIRLLYSCFPTSILFFLLEPSWNPLYLISHSHICSLTRK